MNKQIITALMLILYCFITEAKAFNDDIVMNGLMPTIDTIPPDVTIACYGEIPEMLTLTWTDDCGGSGVTSGTEQSNGLTCLEIITRQWAILDDCGTSTLIEQNITIAPDFNATIFLDENGDTIATPNSLLQESHPSCNFAFSNNPADTIRVFSCDEMGQSFDIGITDLDAANTCLNSFLIDDGQPPVITCPADVTLDCFSSYSITDFLNQDPTQVPVYMGGEIVGYYSNVFDNCDVASVTVTQSGAVDQCGEGTIFRRWTATDMSGRTERCIQRIRLINSSPFTESDIDWPRDATVDCGDGTEPDDLANGRQRPELLSDICDVVGTNYEDEYLPIVDGACYYILRHWVVFDLCQFDVNNDGSYDGYWTHTQVISVRDDTAPTVISATPQMGSICIYATNCAEDIDFSINLTDDCSTEFTKHLFIDGYIDEEVQGSTTLALSAGNYSVVWSLSDGCNNYTTYQYDISVVDCQPPTAICKNNIIGVTLSTSGTAVLQATEVDGLFPNSSYDNCTVTSNLSYHLRKVHSGSAVLSSINEINGLGNSLTFTCNDPATVMVELYVVDENENWDACAANVAVQRLASSCPCADFLILNDLLQNGEQFIYEAGMYISSESKIKAGADIIYDAPDYILLDAEFEVEVGATFLTKLEGCN